MPPYSVQAKLAQNLLAAVCYPEAVLQAGLPQIYIYIDSSSLYV